jgi:hypothetical protein
MICLKVEMQALTDVYSYLNLSLKKILQLTGLQAAIIQAASIFRLQVTLNIDLIFHYYNLR